MPANSTSSAPAVKATKSTAPLTPQQQQQKVLKRLGEHVRVPYLSPASLSFIVNATGFSDLRLVCDCLRHRVSHLAQYHLCALGLETSSVKEVLIIDR